MKQYSNIECKRCGNQWYSEKFEKDGELPDECPYCYRSSVRKIPPQPTVIDNLKQKISYIRKEVPKKAEEQKHQMVLWKENNRLVISMVSTGIVILGVISILTYVLFFP